jgi:hypothetical protein
MRTITTRLGIIVVAAMFSILSNAIAANLKNPMNAPDELAWSLFLQVNANAKSAGNNSALFETWASDHDTFQLNPSPWPVKAVPLALKARALTDAATLLPKGHPLKLMVVPGASTTPSEETRRNKEAYNFIVANNLFKISGLQAAFGTTINFPAESIEVKANWYPVVSPTDPTKSGIPGYTGSPANAANVYHVNVASDGKQYALVAMHVISKQVPNWTWATFEHKNNPARCDIIGCKDPFGSTVAVVPPNPMPSKGYADCQKTPALVALFAQAKIDPAYKNYCLKGSQTDFTTATGQAVRLGNSITENGFVNQSSCMSCHARAAFDNTGKATTSAGFDNMTGLAPIGAVNPNWFAASASANPPYLPIVVDQADLNYYATQTDFVWSIPFCAIDDTATPVKPSACAKK